MRFIKLLTTDAEMVWVNPEAIATIERDGDATVITLFNEREIQIVETTLSLVQLLERSTGGVA